MSKKFEVRENLFTTEVIQSKYTDSFPIAEHSFNAIYLNCEKETKMKELDVIKDPYAAYHVLESSLHSLDNSLMKKEPRKDDRYISIKY